MTLVDLDDEQIAVLRTVLTQVEKPPIPCAQPVEQEPHTNEPLDFASIAGINFDEFDLDVALAGFPLLELGWSSRKNKKREKKPSPPKTTEASFPWANTIIILIAALIVLGIFLQVQQGVPVHKTVVKKVIATVVPVVRSTGDSVIGNPTISASYIDHVLCVNGSPACGTGQALYNDGARAHIDPAFALAFFFHESSYGKAGMATATLSIGNMRCMDGYGCMYSNDGGYASFTSWHQGYVAWYSLINDLYIHTWGLTTVAQIVPRYAPTADHNDEPAYIQSVQDSVAQYRKEGGIA